MTQQDDHFVADEIDEQLEQFERLAQGSAQQAATPNARIVQELQQTYAVQAEKERRSLERVRDRLASRIAGNVSRSQGEKPLRSHKIEPFPAPHFPRMRRIGAFAQTLAAIVVVGVLVGAFLVLLNSHRGGSGAPELHPGSSRATWCVVSSPNRAGGGTILNGVASTSASDAWAVGSTNTSAGIFQPVIEHWNGSRWSIVASPNVGGEGGSLSGGVTAVSVNDAWAVGWSGIGQPLIEHWNGSRWSIVASPNVGRRGSGGSLSGVLALAANDVWTVGSHGAPNPPSSGTQTLIEHWNGTRWSVIPSPNPEQAYNQPQLNAITAISVNDVWAVGYADDPSQNEKTLIEHWNGTRWSIVASPSPAQTRSRFLGVTAISANDVWAVGVSSTGIVVTPQVTRTLIEHWNGTQWSIVASPSPGSTYNYLSGVTAISPSNVLAVGGSSNSRTLPTGQTLIEHWNGTRWSVVASPSPGSNNDLLGVGRVPHSSTVLAVGVFSNDSSHFFKSLTEFMCK